MVLEVWPIQCNKLIQNLIFYLEIGSYASLGGHSNPSQYSGSYHGSIYLPKNMGSYGTLNNGDKGARGGGRIEVLAVTSMKIEGNIIV